VALTDYEVAAIDDTAIDRWRVFFPSPDERDRAQQGLTPAFDVTPVDVPDEDWAARSQASLRAVRVGRLVVAPPWDIPGWSGFSRTIVIQPSMGFGTGHHATTRLCLAALQAIDVRRRSVLDVGTGSGVLAIAASMLGGSPVVALDDDPDAIRSAHENVGMNPGTNVDLRLADLRAAVLPAFDLVVANLTGGLLIQAAARLHDVTTPSGRLILSGFLRHEDAAVLGAFEGCAVAGRAEEEEWVCVTLEKRSSS
jgi:ribosomal protein L11 methyltransferase